MPEIGLLPFARVALEVATAVLPSYRSRFSKHQFTQPQLLAMLCLMRYEDWTFREAEVRLTRRLTAPAAIEPPDRQGLRPRHGHGRSALEHELRDLHRVRRGPFA